MFVSVRKVSTTFALLLVLVLLCAIAIQAQQSSGNSTLSFSIDDRGIVTADISVRPPQTGRTPVDQSSSNTDGLVFLDLPIALDQTAKINAAGNVRIAPIDTG